jgi:hypothetical protein
MCKRCSHSGMAGIWRIAGFAVTRFTLLVMFAVSLRESGQCSQLCWLSGGDGEKEDASSRRITVDNLPLPGDGLFPVNLLFSKGFHYGSWYGAGWVFPLTEAYAVMKDERSVYALLPNGDFVTAPVVNRSDNSASRQKSAWSAEIDNGLIRVTGGDGTQINYMKSHFQGVVFPNGKHLDVRRNGGNEVFVTLGDQQVVWLQRDPDERKVHGKINGADFVVTVTERWPLFEGNGTKGQISGFTSTLSSILCNGVCMLNNSMELESETNRAVVYRIRSQVGDFAAPISQDAPILIETAAPKEEKPKSKDPFHSFGFSTQRFESGALAGRLRMIAREADGASKWLKFAYDENGALFRGLGVDSNLTWDRDARIWEFKATGAMIRYVTNGNYFYVEEKENNESKSK